MNTKKNTVYFFENNYKYLSIPWAPSAASFATNFSHNALRYVKHFDFAPRIKISHKMFSQRGTYRTKKCAKLERFFPSSHIPIRCQRTPILSKHQKFPILLRTSSFRTNFFTQRRTHSTKNVFFGHQTKPIGASYKRITYVTAEFKFSALKNSNYGAIDHAAYKTIKTSEIFFRPSVRSVDLLQFLLLLEFPLYKNAKKKINILRLSSNS